MRHPSLLLPLLLPLLSAQALVRRVPEDLPTIQAAIDSSLASGDTVVVARGVWTEHLEVGPGHLTLASNHLFTGDTLDIEQTVLDGELQRNIVFVAMDDSSEFDLSGMTIRGGMTELDWDTGWLTGGGVHFESPLAQVRLRHLVFRDGRGGTGSALWYAGAWFPFNNARFDLEDINVFDNHIPGDLYGTGTAFVIDDCRTLLARRLFVKGSSAPGSRQWSLSSKDSTDVAGVWISGVTGMLNHIASFHVDRFGHASIRDVYFTNNHAFHPGSLVFSCGEGAHLRLRNIHVSDNHYQDSRVDEASIGPELRIEADNASVDAESLFVNRNRVENCGTLLEAQAIFPATPSWIRHLEVIGNRIGTRTAMATGDYRQSWPVDLTDLSLLGAEFTDNTLETRYLRVGEYYKIAPFLAVQTIAMDTLRVRNVRVENLLGINNSEFLDEDIYSLGAGDLRSGSRALMVSPRSIPASPLRHVDLDSIVVRNCRMPNILPEVDIPDMFQTWFVGSTVGFGTNSPDDLQPTATVRNVSLDGCDDGGLGIGDLGRDLEIENLAIVNTQRNGLYLTHSINRPDSRVRIRNLLLRNIQQEEFHRAWPYPLELVEQSALKLLVGSDPEIDIRNLSILDCDVPILIQLEQRPDGSAYPITNALIAGNAYDFLQPWWDWTPPIPFRYSAVQEAVAGQHNLVADDPLFDPALGPPWLSYTSPCVDAGDPAVEDRDVEDPAHPGVALWPSRGALRNDIGYTGGPGARADDYLVAVEPVPSAPERPAGLTLHPAAPNPFNPSTTLRFTLPRPARARLSAYDLLGREVRVIENRARAAGEHAVVFEAGDLPSGVYLVELVAGRERAVRKVLLVK